MYYQKKIAFLAFTNLDLKFCKCLSSFLINFLTKKVFIIFKYDKVWQIHSWNYIGKNLKILWRYDIILYKYVLLYNLQKLLQDYLDNFDNIKPILLF